MIAILYIVVAVFFGTQLIRLLVPDIRRLYVGISVRQDTLSKIPDALFLYPAGFLIGISTLSFLTYFMAYLMYDFVPKSTHVLLPANGVSMCFLAAIGCICWKKHYSRTHDKIAQEQTIKKLPVFRRKWTEILFLSVVIAAIVVAASFVYFYSFHADGSNVHVGYSVYSDFAPHIALTSSFAEGTNFPTQYPHFASDNIQYHFLFYFLCGNLEALGLPLVWAINLPSILCLVATLCLFGLLAVLLSGRRLSFLLFPILFFFRSSVNIFYQIIDLTKFPNASVSTVLKGIADQTIWYAHSPRDEWGIWAVNVYANQRHLVLGLGLSVILIILFLPHFRRMFLHLSKLQGAKTKCTRFFISREAWLFRQNDPLHPIGSLILACIIVAVMPFFHGSALIAALLILFCMAIFSENRLSYAVVALLAIISASLQSIFFSGSVSSVASFTYHFGFILDLPEKASAGQVLSSFSEIFSYLSSIGFLTFLIPLIIMVGLFIYEIIRKRNIYRPVLIVACLFPLIFAFFFMVSREALANHKFIQITFLFLDVFVAGALANIIILPMRPRQTRFETKDMAHERETPDRPITVAPSVYYPSQIAAAVLSFVLILCLVGTGISEWFVYKNINKGYVELHTDSQMVEWIEENTTNKDVFLTPMWSTNDFFLSGRMAYYGWPYFAWSAGHDTEIRQANYQWLLTGCYGNIDEFRRYCGEQGITYFIASDDYFGVEESNHYYFANFFETYLEPVATFPEINTTIYKIS